MNRFQEKSTRTFIISLALLVFILSLGVLGYHFIENYNWIDSLFMTVITISTVGFKEVIPLSPNGQIFTIVLILMSVSTIAYIGSSLVIFILDGVFVKQLKVYRMEKRIRKLKNHVIVCWYGRNGEQVCEELKSHKTPFVIVENREQVIERIVQNPELLYVKGDASHEDTLASAGIDRARALIAATPNDAENVYIVLTARSLNPSLKIISRAMETNSDVKLKRAGANNVIMPEHIGGQRMAKLVAQPDIVEFVEYVLLQDKEDVSLEEISCRNLTDKFKGKPLGMLKQRDISGSNIVGIKDKSGQYIFNPASDYILEPEDQLFVLGSPEQLKLLRNAIESI